MGLTDVKVRNSKAREKPYKLSDGGGLFLQIQPAGSKWWRYKYRFAGKEKLLALGTYPDVSLSDARERHVQARKALAAGNDPGEVKKEAKRRSLLTAENSFEAVGREWHTKCLAKWTMTHGKQILRRLEADIFPKIGARPVAAITAPEILEMARDIEARGAKDIARRAVQRCGQILNFAIATGRAERNPAPALVGALEAREKKHHAYLREGDLPQFLRTLDGYQGEPLTRLALRLLVLTFVRTTELRAATWSEINWEKAQWRIPAERMKMRDPHIVPLSQQAVAILREIQSHSGGRETVFPNQAKRSGCMSQNTLIYGLYRMGYHTRATVHGFRATASTILNENGFAPDVIERQVAHGERNGVRAAYNHAQYLPERTKMMQWWADYLEEAAKKQTPANN
ncbi:MAG: integrase arm-type DNA-binding domain-containing protein [Verrucomicrobiota bacterium]